MKIKKRTGVDFSKHELYITETDEITIHHLKKPDSVIYNVKFSNIKDHLIVTGDLGNWIFCRNFIPINDSEQISDGYWCEKIQISSTQDPYVFDNESTKKELEELIESGLEEQGYSEDRLEQMKEYYSDCLDHVNESKEIYQAFAYQNYPSFMDYDQVVYRKDVHPQLKVVFDAFEEICNRLDGNK
jgi:hypothetical protein